MKMFFFVLTMVKIIKILIPVKTHGRVSLRERGRNPNILNFPKKQGNIAHENTAGVIGNNANGKHHILCVLLGFLIIAAKLVKF
jgi:hypothetical protein